MFRPREKRRRRGDHRHLRPPGRADLADHPGGRADEVGLGEDVGRTLGVRQHVDARIRLAQGADLGAGEALVHFAVPLPEDQLHARARRHPATEELVGQEDRLRHAE